jgi:hypothetical protein
VEFVLVSGMAAIIQGPPIVSFDLAIVHRRSPENIARLLAWLLARGAFDRLDLANRRLPPKEDQLVGQGHINLQIDVDIEHRLEAVRLDELCELGDGEGCDEIVADTVLIPTLDFPLRVLAPERLIAVNARAGRPKDRAALPMLIATLDEQRKAKP